MSAALKIIFLGAGFATAHMGISNPRPMDQAVGDAYRYPNAGVCHGQTSGGDKVSGTVTLTMSFGASHNGGPCGAYVCDQLPANPDPGCTRMSLPEMAGCRLIHQQDDCTLTGSHGPISGVSGGEYLIWLWTPVSSGSCEHYMNCWEIEGGSGATNPLATCNDGVQNQGEQGVDCGGPCAACATCTDGVQNQGEQRVDCGGPCAACTPLVIQPTCVDGILNQGEENVDCGGPCYPCIWGEWVLGQWGPCSGTCGGGTQSGSVACELEGAPVTPSLCPASKPVLQQACNTQPCGQTQTTTEGAIEAATTEGAAETTQAAAETTQAAAETTPAAEKTQAPVRTTTTKEAVVVSAANRASGCVWPAVVSASLGLMGALSL